MGNKKKATGIERRQRKAKSLERRKQKKHELDPHNKCICHKQLMFFLAWRET